MYMYISEACAYILQDTSFDCTIQCSYAQFRVNTSISCNVSLMNQGKKPMTSHLQGLKACHKSSCAYFYKVCAGIPTVTHTGQTCQCVSRHFM